MEKNMYFAAVQIVAKLRIVMLDDTVLSLKVLVQFRWNMNHKQLENVLTALEAQSKVSCVF